MMLTTDDGMPRVLRVALRCDLITVCIEEKRSNVP